MLEINLIVVSEKIIIKNPIKKVLILSLLYLEFSFDVVINKNGIKDKTGI